MGSNNSFLHINGRLITPGYNIQDNIWQELQKQFNFNEDKDSINFEDKELVDVDSFLCAVERDVKQLEYRDGKFDFELLGDALNIRKCLIMNQLRHGDEEHSVFNITKRIVKKYDLFMAYRVMDAMRGSVRWDRSRRRIELIPGRKVLVSYVNKILDSGDVC